MQPQKRIPCRGKHNKDPVIGRASATQGSGLQNAVLLLPASESPGEPGEGGGCWAHLRPTESEPLGMATGSWHFFTSTLGKSGACESLGPESDQMSMNEPGRLIELIL